MADILAAAVPQIAERVPEYRVLKAWNTLVGPDVARRTRPQSLVNGCLHVVVDNSPWLSELTLRAPELTARLRARIDAVQSLRFTLGTFRAEPSPPAERRERRATLDDGDRRDIEAAASAISDPALADAARRLMTTARRADHARGATR